MSIIRAERKSQFYTLPNATIEDDRLSWEARGMLVYLLSKPDHWKVMVKDLINRTKNALGKRAGRDKVYQILQELRKAGYLCLTRLRHSGEFKGVEYEISEVPDLEAGAAYMASLESPHPEKPDTVAPDTPQPDPAKPENIENTESSFSTERAENPPRDPGGADGHGGPEWVAGMPANYPSMVASSIYLPWMAYAKAFMQRYRHWPLYNRTIGGQMSKLVERIGANACETARFYVDQVTQLAVTENCHPVGMLLKNCESYAIKAQQHAAIALAKTAGKRPRPVNQTAAPAEVPTPQSAKSLLGQETLAALRKGGTRRTDPGAIPHA